MVKSIVIREQDVPAFLTFLKRAIGGENVEIKRLQSLASAYNDRETGQSASRERDRTVERVAVAKFIIDQLGGTGE